MPMPFEAITDPIRLMGILLFILTCKPQTFKPNNAESCILNAPPYTLHPTPYTLHPIPYTLQTTLGISHSHGGKTFMDLVRVCVHLP